MQCRFLESAKIALLVLGVIVSSCSEATSGGASPRKNRSDVSNPGVEVTLNSGLDIADKDIPSLEETGLRGDGKSALKLALFYGAVRHDRDQQLYWTTISAENGDPVGMNNLAYLILHESGAAVRKGGTREIRARFWLERAARAGNASSAEELKRMGNQGR